MISGMVGWYPPIHYRRQTKLFRPVCRLLPQHQVGRSAEANGKQRQWTSILLTWSGPSLNRKEGGGPPGRRADHPTIPETLKK